MMPAFGRKPSPAVAIEPRDAAAPEPAAVPGLGPPERASGAKHRQILEAATRVFLRDGYAAASMDAVAAEAGASKRTVYNHFGSKEALFGTIVRGRCDRLLRAMPLPDDPGPDETGDHPRAILTALARQFLELVLQPESLDMHRLLLGEAARQPELGRMFYRSGPARAAEALAGYLARQAARTDGGGLRIEDPRLAAEQFFGMVLGHVQLRALLGVEPSPDAARLDATVEAAVSAFLAAHRS